MRRFAIILAGGSGHRMGGDIPKQFIEIEGKPILRHTIEKFQSICEDIEIIVVMNSEFRDAWKRYCQESGFIERYIMPSGGITRFHSVQNALKYVEDGAIVAVHDGVRPFVTTEFLKSMFERAESCDALVPVIPVKESLRMVETDGGSKSVDRKGFVLVQTPQMFKSELLKAAYNAPYSPLFTDDASVVEAAGIKVTLCDGLEGNIKITVPSDLNR